MLLDRFRLDGRVAVVTAASRGIGAASALALAECGADVAIAARDAEALAGVAAAVEALGRTAVTVPADLSDLANMQLLVDAAKERFGRIDIVINNIGGSLPRPLLDTTVAHMEHAFHFNVSTAFELTRLAVPELLAGGGGSVVNITSVIGRLRDRGYAAYGTGKAALSHLTRLMAADLAPRIRVNAVAPGAIATAALRGVLNDELEAAMVAGTPLRRLGQPEDIALAVAFLASDAGGYITGKVLEVDGGLETPNLSLGLPDL